MKVQLLQALERLVEAVLALSALPEYIDGDIMGVCTRKPRHDFICPGYSYRHEKNEADLVGMIHYVLFGLVLFATSTKHHYKLRAMPEILLLQEVVDIVKTYQSVDKEEPIQKAS